MHMRSKIASLVLALTTTQALAQDPITDLCRRHQHQTCIVDDKLYVDGGLVYYGASVPPDSAPKTNTWLLSWDLSNVTQGYPSEKVPSDKSLQVPSVTGGVLWPDETNKLFYLFGGEHNNDTLQPSDTLWLYDTLFNTWNRSVNPDTTQLLIRWPAFGAGTVSEGGKAYYYGGYLSKRATLGWTSDNDFMTNGLLSLDMNTRGWTNVTYDTVPRAEGSLQYIPAGDGGMLIYFGGMEMIDGTKTYVWANMSRIHVFDIANSRWYTQNTTGELPPPRRGFCAGVTWAADLSSYNIYIYGGMSANDTALGELYVLTLPSFQWIAVYPKPISTPVYGGKAWASCNVINRTQMVLISGYYTNASKEVCDLPSIGGFHALNMGQESYEEDGLWARGLSNVTQYRVPNNVAVQIGGGVSGGATATSPVAGWVNKDLATPFKTTYAAPARTPTRSVPATSAASTSPTPAPSSASLSSSRLSTGATAGIVVGAILFTIGLACAIAFWCRRRRARNRSAQTHNAQGTVPEMEDQDEVLAKRKWFLAGRWRSEAEAKSDPLELDSKSVNVVAGPLVELDADASRRSVEGVDGRDRSG